VKPSHELLGEILLALHRPADAQREFTRALALAPKRTLSLAGAAQAAAAQP
jgi:cytochrome c-type biogenesis protein CcmH/NrfG